MRYGVLAFAGAIWLAACGGHTRSSPDEPMTRAGSVSEAGTIGEPSSNGGAGSGGVTTQGGAPTVAGTGPIIAGSGPGEEPQDCRDEATAHGCRSGLDLTLRLHERTGDDGTWAEPVHVRTFPPWEPDPQPMIPPVASPEAWDRARLPQGSCMFRIQDWEAGCLGRDTTIQLAACGDPSGRPRIFESYYETPWCEARVAPGCPTAEAWPDGRAGAWWYVIQEDASPPHPTTQLLIVCAPLCALIQEVGAACLFRPALAI